MWEYYSESTKVRNMKLNFVLFISQSDKIIFYYYVMINAIIYKYLSVINIYMCVKSIPAK